MLRALRGLWSAYEQRLSSHPIPTQMTTSCVLWCAGDYMAQKIEHYEAAVYGPNTKGQQQMEPAAETPKQQWQEQQLQQHKIQPLQMPFQQQQQQQQQLSQEHLQQQQKQQQTSSGSTSSSIDLRRLMLTSAFGAGFIGPVGHLWYEGIEKVCRRLVPSGGPRFLVAKVVLDSAIMGSVYVVAFFAFISLALEGTGFNGFSNKMKVDFVPTYVAELAFWPVVQTLNFSQVPVRHQLLVVNTFSLLDAAFISWVGNQEDWAGKILGRLGFSDSKKDKDE